MIRESLKSLREVASAAADMLFLRYPGFVYGESCSGAVPVFCFHGVESASFEAMLAFLKLNGYVTLDADEYHRVVVGRAGFPSKAVVLTFDDGWRSLWSVGFPLLKKYGVKAVVFIVPGRLRQSDSGSPLLSWEEVREMDASGLVDFQSHSLTHSLVCRSPRIVDFVRPEIMSESNYLELAGCANGGAVLRLGEPMYETAPRLSDSPGLAVDGAVADECAGLVESRGGACFFRARGWRGELRNAAREAIRCSLSLWRLETREEQIQAVRREMVESKRAIEEMLPGKVVRHLCYPWHVAGKTALEESRNAGYISGFFGKIGGRYYNPIPYDPYSIARLSGDFFFRLPGKGRVGLLRILLKKAGRRAREGHPYLTH